MFACVCVDKGSMSGDRREEGTNAEGKAAIKAQSAHPLPPIRVGGV